MLFLEYITQVASYTDDSKAKKSQIIEAITIRWKKTTKMELLNAKSKS